jgi:hypothetical protein
MVWGTGIRQDGDIMKKPSPLLAGLILGAAFAVGPLAEAAFVHLSLVTEENGLIGLRGSKPDEPWDTYGYGPTLGPLRLDIYYDPAAAVQRTGDNDSEYTFTDPRAAVWQVRAKTPVSFPIAVERPLDSISVTPSTMLLEYWHSGPFESFELDLFFETPLATALSLPVPSSFPPLQQNFGEFDIPSFFRAQGGQDFFNLPAPGGGMMGADFLTMEAEWVDSIPPLVPVPEPATYGVFGAAGLAALAALRRRQRAAA